MFCRKCGSKLEDGTTFCIYCGTRVKAVQPAVLSEPVVEKTVEVEESASIPEEVETTSYSDEFLEYLNAQNVDLDKVDETSKEKMYENWQSGKTSLNALMIDKFKKSEEVEEVVEEPTVEMTVAEEPVIDEVEVVDAEVEEPYEEDTVAIEDKESELEESKDESSSELLEKIQKLQEENASLKDENEVLKSSITSSEAMYEQLKQQVDKYKDVIDQISKIING